MVDAVLFTPSDLNTENTERETPQWLYDELDLEFDFDLDAAASDANAKCSFYFTIEDDALTQDWYVPEQGIRNIFCNPPYGRGVYEWIEKSYLESQKGGTVVNLLPARTDTRWFHNLILGKAEIRFLRGRLVFEMNGLPMKTLNKKTGKLVDGKAPFPSMVVVFRPSHMRSM